MDEYTVVKYVGISITTFIISYYLTSKIAKYIINKLIDNRAEKYLSDSEKDMANRLGISFGEYHKSKMWIEDFERKRRIMRELRNFDAGRLK